MYWLGWHALPNNKVVKLKTTLPRISQLGTDIYHQTMMRFRWLGSSVRTLQMNVWTRSVWLTRKRRRNVLLFFLGSSCVGYQYDPKAFLFSLVNTPGWAPVKFDQRHGSYQSIYSCRSGPTFGGGHDLQLLFPNSGSYSNLGHTYRPPSGYSYGDFTSTQKSFLAGSFYFNPDEVETFYDAVFTSQGRFED